MPWQPWELFTLHEFSLALEAKRNWIPSQKLVASAIRSELELARSRGRHVPRTGVIPQDWFSDPFIFQAIGRCIDRASNDDPQFILDWDDQDLMRVKAWVAAGRDNRFFEPVDIYSESLWLSVQREAMDRLGGFLESGDYEYFFNIACVAGNELKWRDLSAPRETFDTRKKASVTKMLANAFIIHNLCFNQPELRSLFVASSGDVYTDVLRDLEANYCLRLIVAEEGLSLSGEKAETALDKLQQRVMIDIAKAEKLRGFSLKEGSWMFDYVPARSDARLFMKCERLRIWMGLLRRYPTVCSDEEKDLLLAEWGRQLTEALSQENVWVLGKFVERSFSPEEHSCIALPSEGKVLHMVRLRSST